MGFHEMFCYVGFTYISLIAFSMCLELALAKPYTVVKPTQPTINISQIEAPELVPLFPTRPTILESQIQNVLTTVRSYTTPAAKPIKTSSQISSIFGSILQNVDLDGIVNKQIPKLSMDIPFEDASLYTADLVADLLGRPSPGPSIGSDMGQIISPLLSPFTGILTKVINSTLNNAMLKENTSSKSNPLDDLFSTNIVNDLFNENSVSDFFGNFFRKSAEETKLLAMLESLGGVFQVPEVKGEVIRQMKLRSEFLNQCKMDLIDIYRNRNDKWVWKILDSFGKPVSGILDGANTFYGSYRECREIQVPSHARASNISFRGKYCWLMWKVDFLEYGQHLISTVCVPSTCKSQDIIELYPIAVAMATSEVPGIDKIINNFHFTLASCNKENSDIPLTAGGEALKWFFGFILFLILVCTFLDRFIFYTECAERDKILPIVLSEHPYVITGNSAVGEKKDLFRYHRIKNRPPVHIRLVQSFSLYQNLRSILSTDVADPQLSFFHGIRCFCLTWVVLGHVFMSALVTIENLEYTAFRAKTSMFACFITQGFYAVDTFFVLSGFLVTYIFLKESVSRRFGVKLWILFYLHRYIRLTPSFAVLRWWAQTHWIKLRDGPSWFSLASQINSCATSWTWSMLYLSNFNDNAHKCLSWAWYLANDFQFYAISPIFLVSLKRYPKPTIITMSLLICCSAIYTAVINYRNGFLMMLNYVQMYVRNSTEASKIMIDMTNVLYEKPYCRVGPYLVGMILGYFATLKRMKINHRNQILLWVASISSILTIVFGIYGREISLELATAYNGFGRVGWAIAISWPIYACYNGYGGILTTFLTWKAFVPISKISFTVYLWHPVVMYTYYFSLERAFVFSGLGLMYIFLSTLIISLFVAFIFSLLIEAPIIKLEKSLRQIS